MIECSVIALLDKPDRVALRQSGVQRVAPAKLKPESNLENERTKKKPACKDFCVRAFIVSEPNFLTQSIRGL
ncbi:hypothetical protein Pla110_07010 [Polystyrenella longa]|uniref:Uncharacterized protein n=1 Tax=Polystyrenella longa TaxID=2528007 RepID=A0A518CIH1_9PLAN|nr:hypothetical protein Pla110_07010 [Polystyrenella longa]